MRYLSARNDQGLSPFELAQHVQLEFYITADIP